MTEHETPGTATGNPSGGRRLLVLFFLLLINSAYVAAFGDASLFYVAQAFLHPFLGIAVAVWFVLFLRRRREFLAGAAGRMVRLLLGFSTAFGGYLMVEGMTRPNNWALYAHVALALAGLAALLVVWRSRISAGNSKIEIRNSPTFEFPVSSFETRAWRWSTAVMLSSLAFYGMAAGYQKLRPDPRFLIQNPKTPPLSMEGEGGGPGGFMFPSAVTTTDGKPITSQFFMDSESCKKCHEDIYNQWNSSMHHMASFNNQWYRKSIEYMQDTVGIKASLWCGGCHDHALIVAAEPVELPRLRTHAAAHAGIALADQTD